MKNWKEVYDEEANHRRDVDPAKLCSYGIAPLDDCLKYIYKNDLIVIGADSGAGKTEVALTIAIHNAMRGKKVALYHLEGGHEEAIARIKWREMAKLYFQNHLHEIEDFNYYNWKVNSIKNSRLILQLEMEVFRQMEKNVKEFWIYPIKKGFTVENLEQSLYNFHTLVPAPTDSPYEAEGQIQLDLIIVDHLQYFELTGTESEIVQTTKVLRRLKEISDVYKVPVILISHLRKKHKDRGLPDQEDFYGSSNIPKIATTALLISTDSVKQDFSDNLYPTYFRIAKSRIGIRPNYCVKVDFDLIRREYRKCYDVYFIDSNNFVAAQPIPFHKLPFWVDKSKIIKRSQDEPSYQTAY